MASALRLGGHEVHIRAVSSPETLHRALELGLVDEVFDYCDLQKALPGTDLLLLCGPISHILKTLETLRTLPSPDSPILVSDVGSTKGAICAAGALLPEPFRFVGGHPMAGSEKRSLEYHDPALFENAYWILCPERDIPQESFALLRQLIDSLGANRVELQPEEHDRIMARLSHVPQLVSTALAAGLSPRILEQSQQHLAGRGFRDMTRLAASPWPMWRDIVTTNQTEILEGIREMRATLGHVENFLADLPRSKESLQQIFERGAEVRSSLSAPGKGFSMSLYEIMVQLPDHPGSILSVVSPLTEAGINILDIELAKVREGIGGTLLLGFKMQTDALWAVELLSKADITAKVRP